jgi:lysophospholipase L1-like esterase
VAYLPERRQVSNYYQTFEKEFSPDDFDLTQPAYQAHQRQLAEQCASLGVPFLDLSESLAEEEARGNHAYWDYDDHLRAGGNRVVAGALFEAWKILQR